MILFSIELFANKQTVIKPFHGRHYDIPQYLLTRFWFGTSNQGKLDQTFVETLQHEKHCIGTTLSTKSTSKQTNQGFDIQTRTNHGFPKRSNDI
jgi:hypothetical protein